MAKEKPEKFQHLFDSWLKSALTSRLPKKVKGLSFNLFETGEDDFPFGLELIGADEFDVNDSDWACSEAWEPKVRSISLPAKFSGNSWNHCLEQVRELVSNTISSPGFFDKLKSIEGIGLGFVDGDLEVLWQRDNSNGE